MKLLHYSVAPFRFDPEKKYTVTTPELNFKPEGLWLSVEGEDDWKTWCVGEHFQLEHIKHVSEITLKPDNNVLLIDAPSKLDEFHLEFPLVVNNRIYNIDWKKVKSYYNGLIIAPYQYQRRHTFMWYYGWDCASGVIWNLSVIDKVKAMKRECV